MPSLQQVTLVLATGLLPEEQVDQVCSPCCCCCAVELNAGEKDAEDVHERVFIARQSDERSSNAEVRRLRSRLVID